MPPEPAEALLRCQFDEVWWQGDAVADPLVRAMAAQHLGLWDEARRWASTWAEGGAHVATGQLVSIVVPTRNRRRLLRRALRSVVAQLYRPLEIVVVNDAGEPVSDLLDEFRGTDGVTIVELVNEENLYLAASRNRGLSASSGRYVGFLDDDDQLYPHHVGHLVSVLGATGGRAAHALANMHAVEPASPTGTALRPLPMQPFAWPTLLVENIVPVQCVLFDRALVDETGAFDTALRANEDWEFWIRVRQRSAVEQSDLVTSCVDLLDEASRMSRRLGPFHSAHRTIYERHAQLAEACGGSAVVARQRAALDDIAARMRAQVVAERRFAIVCWGPGTPPPADSFGVEASIVPLAAIDAQGHADALSSAAEGVDYVAFVETARLDALPEGWPVELALQLELDPRHAAAAPGAALGEAYLLHGSDAPGLDPSCVLVRAALAGRGAWDAHADAGEQWLRWFANATGAGHRLRLAHHVGTKPGTGCADARGASATCPRIGPLPPFPPTFVLCYHRVLPRVDDDPFGLAITQDLFEEQLDALGAWCRFIAPGELGRRAPAGDPRPRVLVTFDDGYRDNEEYAFPLLAKRGIPAVLFVATGAIDRDAPFWWETVARAGTAAGTEGWRFLAAGERAARVHSATAVLDDAARTEIEELAATWPALRALAGDGAVTLGAHTHAHSSLGRLGPAELRDEIGRSKHALEQALGAAPRLFAFPHGGADDISPAAVDELQRQGFEFAFTTIEGAIDAPVRAGSHAALTLPRVFVTAESGRDLAARLSRIAGLDSAPAAVRRRVAVLSGISGHNLGDDAMLIAAVRDLRRIDPTLDIRVLAEDPQACGPVLRDIGVPIVKSLQCYVQRLLGRVPPGDDPNLHVLHAVRDLLAARDEIVAGRAVPPGIEPDEVEGLRWLLGADGVIDCGGANLDAHWKSYFYEKCLDYLVAARPLLVGGQGISRFEREEDRLLLTCALAHADLVTVREAVSERYLRGIGFTGPLLTTGDDALSLEPSPPARIDDVLRRAGIEPGEPFVAFQYRHYLDYGEERFLALFARIVEDVHAASGLPVVGVPMHFAGTDERGHLAAVGARIAMPGVLHTIEEELVAGDALGVIARATLAFGISYHSAIFALASATPFLGLYRGAHYAQKMNGLAELYALPKLGLPLDELRPGDVAAAVRDLLRNRDALVAHLTTRQAELLEAVRRPRRAFVDAVVRRADAAPAPPVPPAPASQAPGAIDWGNLRRLEPVSAEWGFDRGQPVDRFYIENFLARHAGDVRGVVCELLNDDYARRYGGDRVMRSEVLDIDTTNARATIVDDLAAPRLLGERRFDCFILTQTLPYIFDCGAALASAFRALKPGGTLLVTVPSIIRFCREPEDHWRFTVDSLARLVREHCPGAEATIESHGNLLAAVGFLYGMASADLSPAELAHDDERFPVLIAARIVRTAP